MKRRKYPGIIYMIKITCLALIVSIVLLVLYKYKIKDVIWINSELKDEIISNFHENKDFIEDCIQKNDLKEIKKIKEVEGVSDLSNKDNKYIEIIYYYEGSISEYNKCGIIYSTYPDTELFLDEWIDDYKKKSGKKGIKYIDMVSDDDLYVENLEDNYYYFQQDY